MSKSKKLVFYAISFLMLYLLIEGVAFVGYRIIEGEFFSASKLEQERAELVEERRQESTLPAAGNNRDAKYLQEILHPYMGYVVDYHDLECPGYGFCDRKMKKFKNAPLTPKGPDDFIVAVFGGSVAYQTIMVSSHGYFEEKLKTLPGLKDKNIIVHTIALGGFKQPQQLMALNWFLSLGASFDMVISLDGFNEVALPPAENVAVGVYPLFPRMWQNRVSKTRDLDLLALYGRIEFYADQRARRAKRLNKSIWRYSPLRNIIWKARDRRLESRISDDQLSAQSYKARDRHIQPLVVTGPDFKYGIKDKELFVTLADNWAHSARQMHNVSEGQGIQYFHFLQPNQYVEGSKPMSDAERKSAFVETHPYRHGVVNGYSLLSERGRELIAEGVKFLDLTDIFKNNEDLLYIDACCHLNSEGYEIVIDRMIEFIRPLFRSPPKNPA
ncbi:MAG: hypothetical protein DHS20C01_30260 [marine bacterium B5-7]|nr:MAG: hypothetical protein DHS20C01_30260 [marine bacterium B5-7]